MRSSRTGKGPGRSRQSSRRPADRIRAMDGTGARERPPQAAAFPGRQGGLWVEPFVSGPQAYPREDGPPTAEPRGKSTGGGVSAQPLTNPTTQVLARSREVSRRKHFNCGIDSTRGGLGGLSAHAVRPGRVRREPATSSLSHVPALAVPSTPHYDHCSWRRPTPASVRRDDLWFERLCWPRYSGLPSL